MPEVAYHFIDRVFVSENSKSDHRTAVNLRSCNCSRALGKVLCWTKSSGCQAGEVKHVTNREIITRYRVNVVAFWGYTCQRSKTVVDLRQLRLMKILQRLSQETTLNLTLLGGDLSLPSSSKVFQSFNRSLKTICSKYTV